VTNITHKTSGGTTLASVAYERAQGGEPTKITREDGTYVVLGYDAALRLTNEVYYNSGGVAQTTNSYGYDASGSRVSLLTGGVTYNNTVTAGYRITQVLTNGIVAESYAYDAGGRVTNMVRSGSTVTLAYNCRDQVAAVTNGASWMTYVHDGAGRRTVSSGYGGLVRRFLVASTPGTDLESPLLVANGTGTLSQGYVYAGANPFLRYDSTGTAGCYLEDGMSSIIALAPVSGPSTANTTRLFYDGFGNLRGTNGPAPAIPSNTGGDFRFQGAWLEAQTGLYNMRAREYDARFGRFTSRDPPELRSQARSQQYCLCLGECRKSTRRVL
jgi:RHS repeat-associated protein